MGRQLGFCSHRYRLVSGTLVLAKNPTKLTEKRWSVFTAWQQSLLPPASKDTATCSHRESQRCQLPSLFLLYGPFRPDALSITYGRRSNDGKENS